MIQPWTRIASRAVGHYRIFSLRSDKKISPRTGETHDFYIIDSVNWVNVIALTPENQLVMIEQFRHGTNTVELEIPGGMMDAEDESPVATGLRELREETGYAGEQAQIIGSVYPNPAIMSNTCFTVLVKNCRLKHPVQFDHTEDLATRLVPVHAVSQCVLNGQIRHSLVVVGLYYFALWQQANPLV